MFMLSVEPSRYSFLMLFLMQKHDSKVISYDLDPISRAHIEIGILEARF